MDTKGHKQNPPGWERATISSRRIGLRHEKNIIKSHPQWAGGSQKEKSRGESERNKVNGREEGNEIRRRPPLLR